MRTPLSPIMRRRLLLGGNCIARAVLRAAVRPTADAARADLRSAFSQFVDLAYCLHQTHPPKGRNRKCR